MGCVQLAPACLPRKRPCLPRGPGRGVLAARSRLEQHTLALHPSCRTAVPPQVLVATSTLAWGVNTPAHLVIIKGTEFYDAPTK